MGDSAIGPENKNKDTWGKIYGIGSGGADQSLGLMPSSKDEAMDRWSTMWGKPTEDEKDFNKMLQGKQADIAKNLYKMARANWQTTQPIMRGVIDNSMGYLTGESNVADHPLYEQNKVTIENQYQDAQDAALANQASGGGLSETLADIEMGRAQGVTGLINDINMSEYNKAFGMATGAPTQAYGGLNIAGGQMGQAAANYNQYMQEQQQKATQNANTAGSFIGAIK